MDQGIFIARLVIGLVMAAHGAQKAFGWFGGYGLSGTAPFFESLGFRPGRPFAAAAAYSELAGGILIALGFLGPIGPALVLSVMIVAAMTVHRGHGLFAGTNGIEVPLLYSAFAVIFALSGPGRYSLDALLGLQSLWTTTLSWAALAVAVIAALGNLAIRRLPAPSQG